MNIIFLDIDGVLNSSDFYNQHKLFTDGYDGDRARLIFDLLPELLIDRAALNRIKGLCNHLDASIVISSSWRLHCQLNDFIRMFEFHGWINAPIIDLSEDFRHLNKRRGDEVNAWLHSHEVDDYIIIDDVNDFYPDQKLCNTSFTHGITEELVQEIMNMFTSCSNSLTAN